MSAAFKTKMLSKEEIEGILHDPFKKYLYGNVLPSRIDPGLDAGKRAKLFVFSLVSANTTFAVATAAWEMLMDNWGNWESPEEIVEILKENKCCSVNIASHGKKGLILLQSLVKDDPGFFFRNPSETHETWATRIADTIPGLGYVKSIFAVCLMEPLKTDLGCPDRHMLRILVPLWESKNGNNLESYLTQKNNSSTTLPRAACKGAITELQQLAAKFQWQPFPLQWALWDEARGCLEDHSALTAIHEGVQ